MTSKQIPVVLPENFRWVLDGSLAVSARPLSSNPYVFLSLKKQRFFILGDFDAAQQKLMKENKIPFCSIPDLHSRIENPDPHVNISPVLDMLEEQVINRKRKVLLCCHFGYTLSPTIAFMFLVDKKIKGIEDALRMVKPLTQLHKTEVLKRYFNYSERFVENRRNPGAWKTPEQFVFFDPVVKSRPAIKPKIVRRARPKTVSKKKLPPRRGPRR